MRTPEGTRRREALGNGVQVVMYEPEEPNYAALAHACLVMAAACMLAMVVRSCW